MIGGLNVFSNDILMESQLVQVRNRKPKFNLKVTFLMIGDVDCSV